jgi:hypothetical protein
MNADADAETDIDIDIFEIWHASDQAERTEEVGLSAFLLHGTRKHQNLPGFFQEIWSLCLFENGASGANVGVGWRPNLQGKIPG